MRFSQSGQIAHELEYVHHSVRNELDEIKRREIIRLRELATKQVKNIRQNMHFVMLITNLSPLLAVSTDQRY